MFAIGSRVIIPINGSEIPGIVTGSPMTEQVTRTNQSGNTVTLLVTRQDVLSLRTNQTTGEEYLTVSPENTRYLFERDEAVVGLDVDKKGVALSLSDLDRKRKEDFLAQQRRKAEAATVFTASDLA